MNINDMFNNNTKKIIKEDAWTVGDGGQWGMGSNISSEHDQWAKESLNEYPSAASVPNDSSSAISGVKEDNKMPQDHPMHSKKTTSKLIKQIKKNLGEGISQRRLADVLFGRLETRYPNIVSHYGPEVVGDTVLNVAAFYAGAEELGTSDISIMLREVMKELEHRSNLDEAPARIQQPEHRKPGSPFDRGGADAYYKRGNRNPHEKGSGEWKEYNAGYSGESSTKQYADPRPMAKRKTYDEGAFDKAKEVAGRVAKTFSDPVGAAKDEYKKPFWTKEIALKKKNKPMSGINYVEEDIQQKAYLDVSHLDRRQLAHLVDELKSTGLTLGTDFFIKSGGESWITYAAYDREPFNILEKYRVGEDEGLDESADILSTAKPVTGPGDTDILDEAPLASQLQQEFMNDLKANSEFFADWQKTNSHELVKGHNYDSTLRKELVKGATDALSQLGWKVVKGTPYDVKMTRNGRWPITIRDLNAKISIYIRDDGNTDDLEDACKMLVAALSKQGLTATLSSDGKGVRVERTGVTAKGVAALVRQALDADMQVHSPRYIENPWNKAGKTQLFPGEVTRYELTAGKLEFIVALDWQKEYIAVNGNYAYSAWRHKKEIGEMAEEIVDETENSSTDTNKETYRVSNAHYNINVNVTATSPKEAREKAVSKNKKFAHRDTTAEKSWTIKESNITETITKVKGGYAVKSHTGKNLGGPYNTKDEAVKRLRQVEYFKSHPKESVEESNKDEIKHWQDLALHWGRQGNEEARRKCLANLEAAKKKSVTETKEQRDERRLIEYRLEQMRRDGYFD